MHRTLLAGFRGADGRSLARALAILLVMAGSLGAIDSGRMAANAAGGLVVCAFDGTATAGHGSPTRPPIDDHCFCCAFGCAGTTPGISANDTDRLPAWPAKAEVGGPVRASLALAARRLLSAGPRGPPGLA